MESTMAIEKRAVPEPLTAPADGNASDYRYETFRTGVVIDDFRFSSESLKPGQLLPDRMPVGADGEEISLRDLSSGRPMVLITGSVTCPLSISVLSRFRQLNQQYGQRLAFAFIYTREAHPGERIEQPSTMAAKREHARLLTELYGVDWPVLVDDLDGTVHRLLDTKQNSVHILDSDGTTLFCALFAGDPAVPKAIAAISQGQRGKTQGRLVGPMRSIGFIEETLRRAGPRAYSDVIKAVPPMAAMAIVARAFAFLPKTGRGWAAAGTLMVGAGAVLASLVGMHF